MSQRASILLTAFVTLACAVLASLPAQAESSVRIVRLSYLDGDAQIHSADQGFTHAVLNMPVTAGTWLYTPTAARAEVQFENGSSVRMVDDALIQFERLSLAETGGKVQSIRVDHGIVYLNFEKVTSDDRITLRIWGKIIRIAKSARLRVQTDQKNARVAVLHGEAYLDGDQPVVIQRNETLVLKFDDPDQRKPEKSTEKLASDAWNDQRDRRKVLMAGPAAENGVALRGPGYNPGRYHPLPQSIHP